METVAFIPVRGGSKSIPLKNIKPLGGRPLVHWTMMAALGCEMIDHVFVASEDAQVRRVAAQIVDERLSVIDRDPSTATDEASTESALLDFAGKQTFENVVLIQATSPLLLSADLDGALAHFFDCGADALLSVTREYRFYWQAVGNGFVVPGNYEPAKRPRRQDWQGELVENGAFYVTNRLALEKSRCRVSGRIAAWEMAGDTALELDDMPDWQTAEQLLLSRKKGARLSEIAGDIALLVTDVDGVLTDAGMYYGDAGETLKKFNTRDGMGLALWRKAGYEVAIMTAEDTAIVAERAKKLGIDRVYQGVKDKGKLLGQLARELGIDHSQVAFIGDDINDLPALTRVGLPACPGDAEPSVKATVHYVCERGGGEGCVRELVDVILKAKDTNG